MSWRNLLGRTPTAVIELSPQTGHMSGIIAHLGVPTEMRRMGGDAAAPHPYHVRDWTHGTVIALVDCPITEATTMLTSTVC